MQGCLKEQAEIKPFEPDPDNAGVGKRVNTPFYQSNVNVMRLLGIMLFLLLSWAQAFTQYAIRGRVTDGQDRALPGAHVLIRESYLGTTTNRNGVFSFAKLREGEYVLEITFIGYRTVTRTVTLPGVNDLEIKMQETPYLADEVVVRATRAGARDPVAQSNMDRTHIEKRDLGQDIPYLLNTTPSLVSTSDAGTGVGYTSLRIRGTDANRINVTINGIPLNDAESHGVYWVDLPDLASSLENVQIQRGVGTSTNGAGAFGATINLQTIALHPEPNASLSLGGGSFNTQRAGLEFGTGLLKDRFTVDGRVSRIYSDGYIDRAFANLKSFSLSGGVYTPRSILRMNLIHGWEETYQAWAGVPKAALDTNRTYNPYTYDNEIDHYEQTHYQVLYSHEFSPDFNLNTALHLTRGAGYYEQYQDEDNPFHQTTFAHYGLDDLVIGPDTIRQTDLVRRLWLDNYFYGTTWSLHYRKNIADLTIGGSWNRYDGDHYGRLIWARYAGNSGIGYQWYLNTGIKTDFNIYAKLNLALSDRFNLYGDIQFRRIGFRISGSENGLADISQVHYFRFLNPKAGIFFHITDRQDAYLSFAVGQREPNRDNFVDALAAGNPEPRAEKLFDTEAGYQLRGSRFAFTLNAYCMYYVDQLVATGEINYVGAPVMTNVPRSYRAGMETELAGSIGDRFSWSVNATLSRNQILAFTEKIELYDDINDWNFIGYKKSDLGNTRLSFSPDLVASGRMEYRWFGEFRSEWLSRYVGRQFIDNTSSLERSVDPYLVNDLGFSWSARQKKSGPQLQCRLMIRNILNEKYETHAWVYRAAFEGGEEYTDSGYFPQAGIHLVAGINLSF